jgi:histone acetyltransferase (RNA polymerase elongator complex component)
VTPRPFIIPVFLPHAGCPHRCAFCNQHAVTGLDRDGVTVDSVRRTIGRHLPFRSRQRTCTEIAFFGGNFLGQPAGRIRDLLSVAGEYVEKGLADGIRFSTRPDTVDRQRLALIAGYPVAAVELGVQSMNEKVLSASRRGHSAADAVCAVERLRPLGCRIGLQMMVGLPAEDEADGLGSAERIAALAPDFVRIYPTVVLAGSLLERWYRQGAYRPLGLDEAVERVKGVFRVFSRSGIPVVRMGLQAGLELDAGGGLVAGPYHPAFGHLVYAALFREAAAAALGASGGVRGDVRLHVNPRCLSRMRGLSNANVLALKQGFGLSALHVVSDVGVPANMLRISGGPAVAVY